MANLFNQFTNKRGLLVYNGESLGDYGMVVAEAPVFEMPTRKNKVYEVPGRNGAIIFQEDSWSDVTRSYKVWLAKDDFGDLATKVHAFSAFLNSVTGYQRLEDDFEPDVFRLAYYNGGNNITNDLLQYGETTLTFTCRPERFLKAGESVIDVSGSGTHVLDLYNPTRFESKPLIKIFGGGKVIVGLETYAMNVFITSSYITLDSDTMNASKSSINMNDNVSGKYIKIPSGSSQLQIMENGGYWSQIQITPRYFTI